MNSLLRSIFCLGLCLALLGISGVAQANKNDSPGNSDKNDPPGNSKNCKVWCPKIKYVCKPCKNHGKPPSSTCNPKDICCSFEIVGWYDCTPKNGKCTPKGKNFQEENGK